MNRDDTVRCVESSCGCNSIVPRRDFLLAAGAGTLAVLAPRLPVMAGPFEEKDFDNLVPADKKLDPEWVKSLYARGSATVYRGSDLKYIGMPVGGICAGQLYLGGDGQLWHWDIFNQTPPAEMPGAAHYVYPLTASLDRIVDQGFTLTVTSANSSTPREVSDEGFSDVSFQGEYPIGVVQYRDPSCPVAITLEAFSPFTPLDVESSSLPATILRFTLTNTSSGRASVSPSSIRT